MSLDDNFVPQILSNNITLALLELLVNYCCRQPMVLHTDQMFAPLQLSLHKEGFMPAMSDPAIPQSSEHDPTIWCGSRGDKRDKRWWAQSACEMSEWVNQLGTMLNPELPPKLHHRRAQGHQRVNIFRWISSCAAADTPLVPHFRRLVERKPIQLVKRKEWKRKKVSGRILFVEPNMHPLWYITKAMLYRKTGICCHIDGDCPRCRYRFFVVTEDHP